MQLAIATTVITAIAIAIAVAPSDRGKRERESSAAVAAAISPPASPAGKKARRSPGFCYLLIAELISTNLRRKANKKNPLEMASDKRSIIIASTTHES